MAHLVSSSTNKGRSLFEGIDFKDNPQQINAGLVLRIARFVQQSSPCSILGSRSKFYAAELNEVMQPLPPSLRVLISGWVDAAPVLCG